jgi:hypothetical protein
MRLSLALLIVSLGWLAWTGIATAAEKSTLPKRAKAYDSPEKAFLAYQEAVEAEDADTAFEALTTESQDTLLFDQWADELTGESWRGELLSKLVDDKKRLELTRAAVPTTRRDLASLLAKSLIDKRAAFAKIMPALSELRHNHLGNYRVSDVKIAGGQATSELRFADNDFGPGPDKMHYVKDDQGWLVDLREDEDFLPQVASAGGERKSEDQPATFASPAAAFAAFESGPEDYLSTAVWDSMTERRRNDFLFVGRMQLVGEHGDNLVLHWYGDLNRFRENDVTNPLPTEQEERAKAFVNTLYDPRTFCAAIVKRGQELETIRGRRVAGQLTDVQIKGNRARGIVKRHFQAIDESQSGQATSFLAYTQACYFQRNDDHWCVDLPTPEERRADERLRDEASAKQLSDAEEKRSRTFESPEEVWTAFHKAQMVFDVATLWDCLIPADRDAMIYNAWAEQFHFQTDPPTLHEVIDEARRRKLTIERLPVLGEEIQPVLMDSLGDRRAAFALSIHPTDWQRQTKEGAPRKLINVRIDGERATAKLERDSAEEEAEEFDDEEPQVPDVAFQKDKQGWRIASTTRLEGIDLDRRFRRELSEEDKKARALKPRDPKPWIGRPPPSYKTPAEVYRAQQRAFRENDPEAAWHCLTEAMRNQFMQGNMLMLVESGGGDTIIAWYSDMGKFHDLRNIHERKMQLEWQALDEEEDPDRKETTKAARKRERLTYRESRDWEAMLARTYYDPRAYFSAIVKRMDLTNRRQQIRDPDVKPQPLDKVTINGDRALGVRTERLVAQAIQLSDDGDKPVWNSESSFEVTIEFAKINGSWRVDVPTLEEHMAQWEKEQEENRKMGEETEK